MSEKQCVDCKKIYPKNDFPFHPEMGRSQLCLECFEKLRRSIKEKAAKEIEEENLQKNNKKRK